MQGYLEKGIDIPMARGRSTKSSRCYGGFGPVGCQYRTLSLEACLLSVHPLLLRAGPCFGVSGGGRVARLATRQRLLHLSSLTLLPPHYPPDQRTVTHRYESMNNWGLGFGVWSLGCMA